MDINTFGQIAQEFFPGGDLGRGSYANQFNVNINGRNLYLQYKPGGVVKIDFNWDDYNYPQKPSNPHDHFQRSKSLQPSSKTFIERIKRFAKALKEAGFKILATPADAKLDGFYDRRIFQPLGFRRNGQHYEHSGPYNFKTWLELREGVI